MLWSNMRQASNRCVLLLISLLFFSSFINVVTANDTDGDGFSDVNDDCPYSNGNSTVDRNGCPDRDGDGTSDYTDFWTAPQGDFSEIEDLRQRLLYQTQSFLLGLPMESIDTNYNPSPSKPSKKPPTKKPFKAGKVVDFKTKKPAEENKKDGKPSNSYKKDPKKDNPDFDFI